MRILFIGDIIGASPEDAVARFLYQTPIRLSVATGPVRFNSVLVELDDKSGRAVDIQRIDRITD